MWRGLLKGMAGKGKIRYCMCFVLFALQLLRLCLKMSQLKGGLVARACFPSEGWIVIQNSCDAFLNEQVNGGNSWGALLNWTDQDPSHKPGCHKQDMFFCCHFCFLGQCLCSWGWPGIPYMAQAVLNSQSCLSFPSAGIPGMSCHVQLKAMSSSAVFRDIALSFWCLETSCYVLTLECLIHTNGA